jgi:general secretion pathway protein J
MRKLQTLIEKIQTPRSKLQRNTKLQISKGVGGSSVLDLGAWSFSGSWILVFGSFLSVSRKPFRHPSRLPRSRAFTLIEVLLALAISAIVLAAIGGVFYSALRLRERTSALLDGSVVLQQSLALLRRDLQGTVAPGGDLAGFFQTPAGGGGMAQNSSIRFHTSTGTLGESAPWADIQEVTYELRTPAQRSATGSDLVRSVSRNLLTTITPEPQEQWLLGGVQSLQFACYDGIDWRETWDTSTLNTNLPTAIRVRIQLATGDLADSRDQHQIEMVIPLVCQSRTNQTQATGGGQ